MKTLLIILICFSSFPGLFSQTTVSGKVADKKGDPLPGVNIYIMQSYEGASSDAAGIYTFQSFTEGNATLIASCLGFEKHEQELHLKGDSMELNIQLTEARTELNTVTISAGSFEASDKKKAVIFRPLDIVTTAGATGDISGALNTLPGTQTVGEEGKLFVRGGDSYETQVFIDGLKVPSFYDSTVPDIPSRSRFTPFFFSGTVFTTGGYSAEYGQALSSALILNTKGLPENSQTSLSLMTLGLGLSHQKKWEKTSFAVSSDFFDLTPYQSVTPSLYEWDRSPISSNNAIIIRHQPNDDGMLKFYSSYNYSKQSLRYPEIDFEDSTNLFSSLNHNSYFNSQYRQILNDKWSVDAGISFTYDREISSFNEFGLAQDTYSGHSKIKFAHIFSEDASIKFGTEYIFNVLNRDYVDNNLIQSYNERLNESFVAAFVESDIYFSRKIVARLGVRGEYSTLLDKFNIAPRLSIAYKLSKYTQTSFAYGLFYQTARFDYLIENQDLNYELASHYILNFQYIKDSRVFRVEGYYKTYNNLVKFNVDESGLAYGHDNSGDGYARGVDVFWRDKKSLKHTDYWISYSFIDTERNYLDFPHSATPSFNSNHNLSVVYKRFIPKINLQVGLTYSIASGRPYDNKNNSAFMNGKTKTYNDISMNISYLTSIKDNFTILYMSMSNVFGFENVFGYRFGTEEIAENTFRKVPVKPNTKRFFFIGLFISFDHK